MQVVIPALGPSPSASRALASVPHRVALTGASDSAYAALLLELWRGGEDFCIVEHDILATAQVIAGLDGCPEPYCGHYYNIGGKMGGTLGCVRWRGAFTREHPEVAWADVPWWQLDGAVAATMLSQGYGDFHRHEPALVHLHPYSGALPTADPYVVIEEQRADYIRYRSLATDERWEAMGICAWTDPSSWGPCGDGASEPAPGVPAGRLDIPVTVGLRCALCVDGAHLRIEAL